jgi:hypothetical protein
MLSIALGHRVTSPLASPLSLNARWALLREPPSTTLEECAFVPRRCRKAPHHSTGFEGIVVWLSGIFFLRCSYLANSHDDEGFNLHRRTSILWSMTRYDWMSILWSSDQIQLIKWGSVQHPNARIFVRLKAWIPCEYFGRVVNRQIKFLWWPSAQNCLTIETPPTASLFADSWLRPVDAPVVTV